MAESNRAPLEVIASSLQRERRRAGLSSAELARRAGIAKSTMSSLESGTGNPSVETLWAISTALGIPFSRLVAPPRGGVQLIRAGQGPGVPTATGGYVATLLASCPPNARRDIYLISAEPEAVRLSDPHSPGVVEHVVIGAGSALAGPADDPVRIGPGDYLSYAGDERHVFDAQEPHTVAVLLSEHV